MGRVILTAGWLVLALCRMAAGQPGPPEPLPSPESHPTLTITRTDTPPVIDGVLDDAVWVEAAVIENLRQFEPIEDAEPTQPTEVRILYDQDAIYFGVRCTDSESQRIIAKQLRRDASLDSDDRIELVIDPFFDRRNGFFFAVNPLGSKVDGLVVDNDDIREDWDGIWYARATRDDTGWTAEIAIPFKTISFNPRTTRWSFNIQRTVRRTNEKSRWSAPQQNKQLASIADAGVLQGIENINQGVGLDVKPYAKIAPRHDAGGDSVDLEAGMDLFYKLTTDMTLTLTFNTDFAETEVDERLVNLTRFPLFFPEKRDFFLQDEGIFAFGGIRRNPLPFQSRRIGLDSSGQPVRIIAGVKLTGRTGPLNIGVLSTYMGSAGEVDRKLLSIARISLNVLDESSVGMITTIGDPVTNGDNVVAGPDFNFRSSTVFGNKVVEGHAWFLYSDTSGAVGEDTAWGLKLSYPNDTIDWQVSVSEIGDRFNAALGFVPRKGIREYFGTWRYRWRPTGSWIRTIDTGVRAIVITDLRDSIETQDITLRLAEITSNAGDDMSLEVLLNREVLTDPFEIRPGVVIAPGDYRFTRLRAEVETADGRPLSLRGEVEFGEFFDGNRLDTILAVQWRPTPHFFGSLEWERNGVDLPSGNFIVQIARARADVLFSTDVSWTNFIQWDNTSETLGLNSRVRWIIEPGNEMFFVVNQAFDTDDTFATTSTEVIGKVVWTFRF